MAQHLQKMYEIGVDGLAFADIAVLPGNSFRSPIRKLHVCKHCSNRMIIAHSAERLMRIFLGERKGRGLKFVANVHYWVQKYFLIKEIGDKNVCFSCCVWSNKTRILIGLYLSFTNV